MSKDLPENFDEKLETAVKRAKLAELEELLIEAWNTGNTDYSAIYDLAKEILCGKPCQHGVQKLKTTVICADCGVEVRGECV